MTKMHVDLWSSSATSVKINNKSGSSWTGATIAAGWNSFDVLLNAFPWINFSNVFQMSLSSTPAGTTVYFRQFYFISHCSSNNRTYCCKHQRQLRQPMLFLCLVMPIQTFLLPFENRLSAGSTLTEMQIAGNDTKKIYTNLNYFA
jgi:hypothetical protein